MQLFLIKLQENATKCKMKPMRSTSLLVLRLNFAGRKKRLGIVVGVVAGTLPKYKKAIWRKTQLRFCIFQSQNLCILYVYRNTFTVIFNCPVVPFSFLNFNMKELGANCSKVDHLNPTFANNFVTEFKAYTQENWDFSS